MAYDNLFKDYVILKRVTDGIIDICFDVFAYRLGPNEWDAALEDLETRIDKESEAP